MLRSGFDALGNDTVRIPRFRSSAHFIQQCGQRQFGFHIIGRKLHGPLILIGSALKMLRVTILHVAGRQKFVRVPVRLLLLHNLFGLVYGARKVVFMVRLLRLCKKLVNRRSFGL